jgi:hypothetical protein
VLRLARDALTDPEVCGERKGSGDGFHLYSATLLRGCSFYNCAVVFVGLRLTVNPRKRSG